MLHRFLWLVLGIQDGKFSEHRHVRTLKTQTSFHQGNKFVEETVVLVLLDQLLQLFCVDNQVEAANLGQTEFSLVDTGLINMFPDPDISVIRDNDSLCRVCLSCAVDGILIFPEMYQSRRQTSPVGDTREEDLGSLVQFFIVTFLTNVKDLL